jgi:hypothetical protein
LPDGSIVHHVDEGETLYWIAELYSQTLESLLTLNSIDPEAILWIGQPIVVDVVTPTSTATPEPFIPTLTVTPRFIDKSTPTATLSTNDTVGVNDNSDEETPVVASPTLLSDIKTEKPSIQQNGVDSISVWIKVALAVLLLAVGVWLFFRVRQSLPE